MPRRPRQSPEERALQGLVSQAAGSVGGRVWSAPVPRGDKGLARGLAGLIAAIAANTPWQHSFMEPGVVAVVQGHERWYPFFAGQIGFAHAALDTPGSSPSWANVRKNGISIFTSPSHRPVILSGQNAGLASAIDLPDFVVGDYFQFDWDVVGPGAADGIITIGGVPILGDPAVVDVGPNYYRTIFADGPFRWWRLKESSGTTAFDSSGHSVNGTYSGAYTLGAAAVVPSEAGIATSTNFAVSGGGQGVMLVDPDAASAGLTTYSIEFWVKTTDGAPGSVTGATTGSNPDGLITNHVFFDAATKKIRFFINDGGAKTVTSAAAYNDGNPHHVVALCTAGVTIELYVDGVSQGTTAIGTPVSYGTQWYFGHSSGFDGDLHAYLQELAIYNYRLSAAQILAHYNAGL